VTMDKVLIRIRDILHVSLLLNRFKNKVRYLKFPFVPHRKKSRIGYKTTKYLMLRC